MTDEFLAAVGDALDSSPRKLALEELREQHGDHAVAQDFTNLLRERVMFLHDNPELLEQPDQTDGVEAALGLE